MTHNEKVLRLLSDGKPHTHHELYALHVIAHSRVSDLRAAGHVIEQWRDGDNYLYRLLTEPGGCTPSPSDPGRVQQDRAGLSSTGNGEGTPGSVSSIGGSLGDAAVPATSYERPEAPAETTDGAALPQPGQLTLEVAA